MFTVEGKTFEQFVAALKEEYKAQMAFYNSLTGFQKLDWADEMGPSPSDPTTRCSENELREWYDRERKYESRRAAQKAEKAEREFVRDTCFPIPDYWEFKDGSVMGTVVKGRKGPTTYMLQIAPAVKS